MRHPFRAVVLLGGYLLHAVLLASAPAEIEGFVSEKNPGKGVLNLRRGAQNEAIEIGGASGRYAYGVVFRSNSFPDAAGPSFRNKFILQIALGSFHARETQRPPQFAAMSVLTAALPTSLKTFPILLNSLKPLEFEEKALLMFSSPKLPVDQNDEARLKNTLYGKSGTVSLIPNGESSPVELRGDAGAVKFKLQTYRMEIKALVSTPFDGAESELSGTIELPLYAPRGTEAEKYSKRVASRSLSTTAPAQIPEGISSHKRELSGSTKANKNEAPAPLDN